MSAPKEGTKEPMKPADIKIILLGDSAVGKSKLMERFLLNDYVPHQLSTYALTLYRYNTTHPQSKPGELRSLSIDFWDTAGQERFQSVHPSYYMGAHACILVFDVTRKVTYKNLDGWYEELSAHRGHQIPLLVAANKTDMDTSKSRKTFGFVERVKEQRGNLPGDVPLFFVSASNGANVVAVFQEAIKKAVEYKEGGGGTFVDEVLQFIEEEEKREGGMFSPEKASASETQDKLAS